MKLGIIIIFRNNQDDIDVDLLTESLNSVPNMRFCLVDNESKDETMELLFELKENCSNVSIVEIKKQITQKAAKRAGSRFMFNNYDLRHIGYVDVSTLKSNQYNFNEFVKLICKDNESIIKYDKDLRSKYLIKPTLFNSVFSVLEYINEKYNNDFNSTDNLLIV